MSINTYDLGDLVRITGTFKDEDGAVLDPTTVYFEYKTPAGVVTTLTYGIDGSVIRDSTGVYHCDLDANASGEWYCRWYSTGTGQAAEEEVFYVNPTNLA